VLDFSAIFDADICDKAKHKCPSKPSRTFRGRGVKYPTDQIRLAVIIAIIENIRIKFLLRLYLSLGFTLATAARVNPASAVAI
jgi:hypothetical protein